MIIKPRGPELMLHHRVTTEQPPASTILCMYCTPSSHSIHVPSELCMSTGKFSQSGENPFWVVSHSNYVYRCLKQFPHLCSDKEDCGGWHAVFHLLQLSGRALGAQARRPGFNSWWLLAFIFLHSCLLKYLYTSLSVTRFSSICFVVSHLLYCSWLLTSFPVNAWEW